MKTWYTKKKTVKAVFFLQVIYNSTIAKSKRKISFTQLNTLLPFIKTKLDLDNEVFTSLENM